MLLIELCIHSHFHPSIIIINNIENSNVSITPIINISNDNISLVDIIQNNTNNSEDVIATPINIIVDSYKFEDIDLN